MSLLREVWLEVSRRREHVPIEIRNEILWDTTYDRFPSYVKNMICQTTGVSTNWQHGELYVALSRSAAVKYARGGARFGGELLTWCKKGLEILEGLDQEKAAILTRNSELLHNLLRGTELPPILVEFRDVHIECLVPETQSSQNAAEFFLSIAGHIARNDDSSIIHKNFRLSSGCGTIEKVYEIHEALEGTSDEFHLREIDDHDLWG